MGKKFKNFAEMITGLTGNDEVTKNLREEIGKRTLAKHLFLLRCKHGLTQEKLAERIKCAQPTISKIEGSYDEDLALKDIIGYVVALGYVLEVGIRPKDVRIIDQLNHHINGVRSCLNKLGEIPKEDESMEKAVLECCKNTLYSTIDSVAANLGKLKIVRERLLPNQQRPIQINPPLQEVIAEECPPPKLLK